MTASGASVRVLIVDDSAAIRGALGATVDAHPRLEVVGMATDGLEGIAAARMHRPDVVLMDVRMPVLDGIAATRAIADELPDTAVVMLSAYDDRSIAAAAADAGATGFVHKGARSSDIHEELLRAAT